MENHRSESINLLKYSERTRADKKRVLGKVLTVSSLGFGCMGMTHAYGAPSDTKEMTGVLHQAVDMGYLYFDTAKCYTSINFEANRSLFEYLRTLAREKNATPAQISLAWMICKKPYICLSPAPGSRRVSMKTWALRILN